MTTRVAGAALLAASLAACGQASGRYASPVNQVYARLATNDLKDFKFARQCGLLIDIAPTGTPGRSVTWRATSEGEPIATFSALLTPVSANRTQVEVRMQPLANGREPYDGTLGSKRPAFLQPLRPAIEEAIASAIEGRPFDDTRVPKIDIYPQPGDTRADEARKRKLDAVNVGCRTQRESLEDGTAVFSIHDRPGDTDGQYESAQS